MNLYNLSQEYIQLQELLNDPDADPILVQQILDSTEESINQKAENICKIIKNMDADIEALKKEEDRLKLKRQSTENGKERLKAYLKEQLELTGLDKVKTPLFSVGLQNNPPSVNVLDESLIPEDYKVYEPSINKKAILELLKQGKEVPGVEIKVGQSLRIR